MADEEPTINLPSPSTEIQQFLNSSFFSESSAQGGVAQNTESYFSQPETGAVSSESQKNLQSIHNDMVREQNPPEVKPVGKIAEIQPLDIGELIKPSVSSSTQQAVQSITDIKRRTDALEIDRRVPEAFNPSSTEQNNANNVVNNVTNVTQVVPDYLLGLKQRYGSLPSWREING